MKQNCRIQAFILQRGISQNSRGRLKLHESSDLFHWFSHHIVEKSRNSIASDFPCSRCFQIPVPRKMSFLSTRLTIDMAWYLSFVALESSRLEIAQVGGCHVETTLLVTMAIFLPASNSLSALQSYPVWLSVEVTFLPGSQR